jgi:hypothetical protein
VHRLRVLVAVVALVAACGDKNNDRIPAAASLTIDTATTLAPTTTSGGGSSVGGPAIGSVPGADDEVLHGVGEAVSTANGNTVTLRSVDPSGAGTARYGADVEICANQAARVSPSQFTLELANGSAVPSVGDGKQPALAVSDVAAGSCSNGWVTFQLPPDQPAVTLVFRGSSVIRWSLV